MDTPSTIPAFDDRGHLPPGVYQVTLADIEARLTWNSTRRRLFRGLKRALVNLARAGVTRVLINGSFVTAKDRPKDIDGCWDAPPDVSWADLDPVLLLADPGPMQRKYGIDFFLWGTLLLDAGGQAVEEFFQHDRSGNAKGVLVIELGAEP